MGPVEARIADGLASLGGSRQLSVLAILLLHANEVVPSERLIDLVWNGSAPPTAATALQGYGSGLRKAIERDRAQPSVILTQGRGYVARVAQDELDVLRFEELASRGRAHLAGGRPQEAADAFADALALWRGPALANVRDEPFAQEPIRHLEELRIAAIENHVEARLATGQHGEVIAQLELLVAEHPLRERLRGQLMLALYRSGRQAEALEAFAAARRMLVDELGIEPAGPLRALHQSILEQDPALAAPQPAPAAGVPRPEAAEISARSSTASSASRPTRGGPSAAGPEAASSRTGRGAATACQSSTGSCRRICSSSACSSGSGSAPSSARRMARPSA